MVIVELMVPVEGGSFWVQDTRVACGHDLSHGSRPCPVRGHEIAGPGWPSAVGAGFDRPAPSPLGSSPKVPIPTRLFLGDLEYPMVADSAAAAARQIPGCELTT